jgi:two-component system, response regulator PdtaR
VTRVVVADDETLVRADVRATLERIGLDVCGEAVDGREAVALTRLHLPDLVVIDAGMPVLDGVEASRQILAELDVPIVMLTGYSYGDLISRALEVGVAAYVVKPFAEEALLEAVAAALGRGHTRETLAYLRRRD